MVDLQQDDVTEMFEELATGVPDAAWERLIPYVNKFDLTQVGDDEDTAQLARLYLAAHIAKRIKIAASSTGGSAGTVGPVISESVGGIRRSYAFVQMTSSDSSFKTTVYGQMYLDLLATSLAAGPWCVGVY